MLTGVLLANGTLNASILNSLYNENLVKEGISSLAAVKACLPVGVCVRVCGQSVLGAGEGARMFLS